MHAALDLPLPPALGAGRADALFVSGPLDGAGGRLEVRVDGVGHAVAAAGSPRRFWGVVPVPPLPAGESVELVLHAGNGREARLGAVAARQPDPPPPAPAGSAASGLIAVCMATFEPDAALFEAQVESLRAQTDTNWVCVVSDDASGPAHLDRIRAVLGDDPRFVLHPSPERRSFFRNFERALRLAPAEAELVALCDQDDRWRPDKLARLRAALRGGAALAYSDQRLVDAGGRVLRDTMWEGRANNATDLGAMLVANTVTGAAALMRRDVAELAMPFPHAPGIQFHDHWIGCVALASGDLAYVGEPLYDYVQHGGAVFGDVSTGERRRARRPPSARAAYFHGYLARALYARVLLGRCADRLTAPKRRALERFLDAEASPGALAQLAARGVRARLRNSATLGAELGLAQGILWRHAVAARLVRDTAVPHPGDFEQRRLRRWRARL